jgi:sulfatase modifying factor 1
MAAWVHRSLDMLKVDPQKGVLVVFVDDLDRCLPPKMVQVLEAVKLFMDKEGGVFVLGADTEIVRQAIEKQYETAGVKGQSASDYLEKIMQLRFELPVSSHADMQTLLDGEKIIGADWGDSWRLLITGAEINPRKVKTFVNDLNLQWAMLVNSGQARDVNRADFNAWQVLMRVAPANFVQQVRERIEDVELRYNFVMDAIKWGRGDGDETLKTTFQDYDSWRLRRVLRDIAFSADFNAPVLDAFVHLVAPPEKEQPKPEPALEQPAGKTPAQAREVEREELPVDFNFSVEPEALETAKGVTRGGVGRDVIPPRGSREGAIVVHDMEFMLVPKGKFIMGSKDDDRDAYDDEKPQHTVEIPYDYWLARFTVTNAQFGQFVKASGYKTTAEEQGSAYAYDGKEWKDTQGANWLHPRGPKSGIQDRADHPVVSVSWLDAMTYVKWLNESFGSLQKGMVSRLPTEAEWEKAARGAYGNLYPWGNEAPDAQRCNFNMNLKDTAPVSAYPAGVSSYGCEQMSGNVWEWTHTLFEKYPYAPDAKRENEKDEKSGRVLRGGSFYGTRQGVRSAFRGRYSPPYRGDDLGFRVCLAPISKL